MAVQKRQRLVGGRSNQVFQLGATVLKVYNPVRANPLFANDPQREALMLRCLDDTGLVPRFVNAGLDAGLHWIEYAHVSGTPWHSGAGQVAQILAKLHRQKIAIDLPKGANGSADLEAQTEVILAACQTDPGLGTLRPRCPVAPLDTCALIHGDPVPGNILVASPQWRLIDWQCPVWGDPAEDLAVFLSPSMQFLYRGAVLSAAEEQEFLSAYPDPNVMSRYLTLRPWFHWRMAAYCAWRAEKGAAADRQALSLEVAKLRSLSA
ncbi:phosphotransferase [Epibacterium sp. SM1979]|uniref:Phosphotransferase n=1 Tax=Tritonibacter litoralis TaxID=2662264 RepID=A0A843YGA3_9RHOB|nr:phosphotransferase [Tritonibacter litoralis]